MEVAQRLIIDCIIILIYLTLPSFIGLLKAVHLMDAHAVEEVVDAAAEVDVMAVEVASEEVVGVVASA